MTDKLAIEGGKPSVETPPVAWPIHDDLEKQLLFDVLESGRWSELSGTRVQEFSQKFAAFQGASFGVSVPSGTLALETALQALGVGPGDEVITTSYTFIATATAILSVGAKPVFVDIDPQSNSIDPTQIEPAITKQTIAIAPVHVGGNPCDMDAIMEIGDRHGIAVLEDACQAPGSSWKGKPVGSIGACGAFSFQESKNLTAGEGGIVITNDQHLYERAWAVHNCGRHPEGGLFEHSSPGTNFRMTEWQAAILLAQLERLPSHIIRRHRSAGILNDGLQLVPGVTPISVDARTTSHAWHLYQFSVDPTSFGGRSLGEIISALNAEGVACSSGYEPLNYQNAIRGAIESRFGDTAVTSVPNTEFASAHTVWLPQTVLLGEDETLEQNVAAVAKIQRVWG